MEFTIRLTMIAALLLAGSAVADDVRNTRSLLCSVLEAHLCLEVEGCVRVLPEDMNIPQFIRIDTGTRKLSTTPASGERRETVAKSMDRIDGQLILQGIEANRAFSLLIDEASGLATFASAADGGSVSVFAACTPATEN